MSNNGPPKMAKPGKPVVKPPAKPSMNIPTQPTKTFKLATWTDDGQGEKVILYGKSGSGKTTLAAMAPNAVFIGVDDGGRKILNNKTGKPITAVPGIESFQDIRDALRQPGLFPDNATIVVDTITKVEELAINHIMQTIRINGRAADSFRKFGWDGERHILDQYRLLLTDFDAHVRSGRNIILLAQLSQITVANAEGADYLEDGPKLQHRKDCSVRTELVEWADHVARIGYLDFEVDKADPKARAGKVTSDDSTRAVFTGGAPHFIAKSRPVTRGRKQPFRIPATISFADEADDSLWQYIFEGAEDNG